MFLFLRVPGNHKEGSWHFCFTHFATNKRNAVFSMLVLVLGGAASPVVWDETSRKEQKKRAS